MVKEPGKRHSAFGRMWWEVRALERHRLLSIVVR
jgi:hypothetical protein